jgi:NADH-quinone oxidoreductase subunit J
MPREGTTKLALHFQRFAVSAMAAFFFYFFSALTIVGALFVVFHRNPVNSAMCMIVALVGVAALFGLLHAYFLAMLQVVVYAGAVMVLFLFIIMLLDTEAGRPISAPNALAGVLALLILAIGAKWLADHYAFPVTPPAVQAEALPPPNNPLAYATSAKAFGYGLFTKYMLPFQVTGFLLLIAMVGVIVLSKRPTTDTSRDTRSPLPPSS